MKIKVSYHNHTDFSDGKNTLQEMVEKAIDEKYTHFVISDHIYDPLYEEGSLHYKMFDDYIESIEKAKRQYHGKIILFSGIEAEWYLGEGTKTSRYENLCDRLDFTVGSVHYLNPGGKCFSIDDDMKSYTECMSCYGNIETMINHYFDSYLEMVENLRPNLCAHVDLIRKNNINNCFFRGDEAFIIRRMEEVADVLKRNDMVTEINGGGNFRYNNDVYYPSDLFLTILKQKDVKMTVGLDAHSVDMVSGYYQESLAKMRNAGYKNLWYYEDGQWREFLI